jgi:hypothetical protein
MHACVCVWMCVGAVCACGCVLVWCVKESTPYEVRTAESRAAVFVLCDSESRQVGQLVLEDMLSLGSGCRVKFCLDDGSGLIHDEVCDFLSKCPVRDEKALAAAARNEKAAAEVAAAATRDAASDGVEWVSRVVVLQLAARASKGIASAITTIATAAPDVILLHMPAEASRFRIEPSVTPPPSAAALRRSASSAASTAALRRSASSAASTAALRRSASSAALGLLPPSVPWVEKLLQELNNQLSPAVFGAVRLHPPIAHIEPLAPPAAEASPPSPPPATASASSAPAPSPMDLTPAPDTSTTASSTATSSPAPTPAPSPMDPTPPADTSTAPTPSCSSMMTAEKEAQTTEVVTEVVMAAAAEADGKAGASDVPMGAGGSASKKHRLSGPSADAPRPEPAAKRLKAATGEAKQPGDPHLTAHRSNAALQQGGGGQAALQHGGVGQAAAGGGEAGAGGATAMWALGGAGSRGVAPLIELQTCVPASDLDIFRLGLILYILALCAHEEFLC